MPFAPRAARIALAALCAIPASAAMAQNDLLPDILTRESDLYDNDISTSIVAGRRHLRLSNGTANVGVGKLHLYGGPDNGDGTQQVMQRVFRDDGTYYDRLAGNFVYHPEHNHIHFDGWAQYRLREVLPGDGVGPIIAEGEKTSFCIIDLGIYDSSLPGFPPSGEFRSCGSTIQGLSIGWIDVYSKGLPDQNIDVTDVPAGEYWLESEANPGRTALESDYKNNIARIKITLTEDGGVGGALDPDAYEPNDADAQVLARPVGGPNSPNLGPCGPTRLVENLTINTTTDRDRFRFYMPATGTSSDFVRAIFNHSEGDLDMALYNSSGALLTRAESVSNDETISMNGRAAGWYTAEVYGWNGATAAYSLLVDPSANGAPSVTPIAPQTDASIVYSIDTYMTTWTHSDPEGNEAWVSVFVSETGSLGDAEMLPTSLHTPAAQGQHVINTAYLESGKTYHIYHQITDGGAVTGAWTAGTLTVTDQACSPADITAEGSTAGNPDGLVTLSDFSLYLSRWSANDPEADITAEGACNPGSGGDGVSLTDFSCYLATWSAGCP